MSDFPAPLVFVDAPPTPETVNALAYGPSGCGKSTLAATAPGPVVWLNFEGSGALAYARKTALMLGTEIREIGVAHQQDPRPVLRQLIEYTRDPENGVQTVVIDTIGKLRDSLQFAIGGKTPSLPQWGEIGRAVEDAVRLLRDEPVNLVVLAHEAIEDSDNGDRIIRPMIGGKTTEKIVAEMDIVAYLGVKRDETGVAYLAQFVEDRGRRAKDRSGGLGTVRPSDFSEWLHAYRTALGGDVDNSDLPFDPDAEEENDAADVVDQAVLDGAAEMASQ